MKSLPFGRDVEESKDAANANRAYNVSKTFEQAGA